MKVDGLLRLLKECQFRRDISEYISEKNFDVSVEVETDEGVKRVDIEEVVNERSGVFLKVKTEKNKTEQYDFEAFNVKKEMMQQEIMQQEMMQQVDILCRQKEKEKWRQREAGGKGI